MGAQRKGRRSRREHQRGLVVTEGTVTEKQYLDELKQILRGPVAITVVGVGKNPGRVLHEAEKKERAAKEPYDWICCVVDVDQHRDLDQMILDARKSGKKVVVTNLKFEQWLLWHIEDGMQQLNTRELDRLMKEKGLMRDKHLSFAFPVEDYPKAVETARKADPGMAFCHKGPCPSSAMPLLIELMEGRKA